MFKKLKDLIKGLFGGNGRTRNPQRGRAGTHASPQFDSDAFDIPSQVNDRDSNVSAELEKFLGSDKSLSSQEKKGMRYSQAPSELKKNFKKPRRKSTKSTISV